METIESNYMNMLREESLPYVSTFEESVFDYEYDKNSSIIYPESDGKPMADSTTQFNWIITIQGGLDSMFKKNTDVFVAGNLLWYPEEGQPTIAIAPDIMVAFGRPKGDRNSYKQWLEDNIAPQVVFEIYSHSNTTKEMMDKLRFCEKYGVEEFYIYKPNSNKLYGWTRKNKTDKFDEILFIDNFESPLLGVRFQIYKKTIKIITPKNKEFLTFVEQSEAFDELELEKEKAVEIAEKALASEKIALASEKLTLEILEEEKAEKEKALASEKLTLEILEEEKAEKEKALASEKLTLEILEEEKAEKEKAMAEIERLKELLKNKFYF